MTRTRFLNRLKSEKGNLLVKLGLVLHLFVYDRAGGVYCTASHI